MKTDRFAFPLVALAVVAGLVLSLVNPTPSSHTHVAALHLASSVNP